MEWLFILEHRNRHQPELEDEPDGLLDESIQEFRKTFKCYVTKEEIIVSSLRRPGKETELTIPAEYCGRRVYLLFRAIVDCPMLKSAAVYAKNEELFSNFWNCKALERVWFSDSLIELGGSLFRECGNLKELYIPASVKRIAGSLRSGCPNLTIHAPVGSYAEQYAKQHNIPFVEE